MDLRELPAGTFARHPWEIARADFFLGLLREHPPPPTPRALDIGAGDGYLASRLLAEGPGIAGVLCFDPAYDEGWLRARPALPPGLAFTREWPDEVFALVFLLDVLEHADDDRALLTRAVTHAAPGATLVLSAPAHPALFGRHDVRLEHRRRYSSAGLRQLASAVGLEELASGQLFTSLLLPRLLGRAAEALRGRRAARAAAGHVETPLGSWHHGPMLTRAATRMLAADVTAGRIGRRLGLTLPGLSTWVVARKP